MVSPCSYSHSRSVSEKSAHIKIKYIHCQRRRGRQLLLANVRMPWQDWYISILFFPTKNLHSCLHLSTWFSRNSWTSWVPGFDVTNEGLSLQTIDGCRTGPTFSKDNVQDGSQYFCVNPAPLLLEDFYALSPDQVQKSLLTQDASWKS